MSELLRLATAGSVDDGKSTLIGRLLYDSKAIFSDQLEALERTSLARGIDYTDLALLTDGLRAEREQGITIDVAYRYFATPKRKFIIADTPGHVQYTRNMVTGASNSDLAMILVDARNGITEQSRRHAFLSSLLGIPHLVLCVNKMDLVDWSEERFEEIRSEFVAFATRLEVHDLGFVPISALQGDNVVHRSMNMPWFEGAPLLRHLEDVYIGSDQNLIDPRFPVQYVIRPQLAEHHDYRGYAGTVASGIFRPGDEVVVLPSGIETTIDRIETADGPVPEAFSPMAVTMLLTDHVDISRGDMLCRPANRARTVTELDATICWMDAASSLRRGSSYLLKHTTRTVRCQVVSLTYQLDINTLHRDENATELALNGIGRVQLRLNEPIFVDDYDRSRATGSFILIDPVSNLTAGAGMIRTLDGGRANRNIVWHEGLMDRDTRWEALGVTGVTVWLTGLSGSGKSTVATAVERILVQRGQPAFVLDGDNLRHGLNSDLGFGPDDRQENIRRAGQVARLFAEAGTVALVALISPFTADRETVRELHGMDAIPFVEVYVNTPIEECEARDTKGLYARARAGELKGFTGVDDPYEVPARPEVELTLADGTIDEMAQRVVAAIDRAISERLPKN